MNFAAYVHTWRGPCSICGAPGTTDSDDPPEDASAPPLHERLCPRCSLTDAEFDPQRLRKQAWWLLFCSEFEKRVTPDEFVTMRREAMRLLRMAGWLAKPPAAGRTHE